MKVLSTAYRCEFCRKLYERKDAAQRHEAACTMNPSNRRPCHSCPYLTKKDINGQKEMYAHEDGDGLRKETFHLLFCERKQLFLYPPKNEHKKNAIDFEEWEIDAENLPMPKQCEFYPASDPFPWE